MDTNKLAYGPHISLAGNADPFEAAAVNGYTAVQTHWGNPRSLKAKAAKKKHLRKKSDPVWVVHACYIAHAAMKPEIAQVTHAHFNTLLREIAKAGAQHYVVHVGGTKDRDPDEIAKGIRETQLAVKDTLEELAKAETPVHFLVENVANKNAFNENLEKLANVTHEPYWGWCLDLAHSNACGIDWAEVQRVVKVLPPKVAHINYPGSSFGSGLDRHGWRAAPGPTMTGEATAAWDKTICLLRDLGVTLISEGGSNQDSSLDAEVVVVKGILES